MSELSHLIQAISAIVIAVISWKLGYTKRDNATMVGKINQQKRLMDAMAKVMENDKKFQTLRGKIYQSNTSDDFNRLYDEILDLGSINTSTRVSKKS